MLTATAEVISTIMQSARTAGFETHREFFPADLMKKRSVMAAVVGVSLQKDIAECIVDGAPVKEIETVITVKLFGKGCAYTDSYELEDMTSHLFEELACSGDLLSRVTKLTQIKQNGSLGRLE